MPNKNKHSFEFEGYRLDVLPPSLWRDGQLVSLPPKVLEMLILLVEKRGEIVTREELLETVWPDTHVEEGNIKYTISLLRKALGKSLVQTVPRRGYLFVGVIREVGKTGKLNAPAKVFETHKKKVAPSKGRPRRAVLATLVIGILLLTGIGFWWWLSNKPVRPTLGNMRSVAILPLKNLGADETGRAFSLGLTDLLISRLGSLNRFTVRPLDAVQNYQTTAQDPLKFGEAIKVDAVLEGTFQAIDNRLRVNIRLLDVRNGAQIWTAKFDETESDPFTLQDKLATQVANSLVSRLTQQEQSLLARRSTDNAEAYRAYVRGRAILDRKNADVFDKAVEEFQKAVTLDPAFALAYAGLADAFLAKSNLMSGDEAAQPVAKSRLYAQKALDLGEESAEVYTALGRIKRIHDWDWEGAERDFLRAIQLNPNHAEAHRYYGQMLSFLGRQDEAMAEIKQAMEINPISPAITMAQFSILESRGEYDAGLKMAQEFYRFEKENPLAKRAVATFLFHTGEYPKVIEIGEHLTQKDERQRFAFLSLSSTAYAKTRQAEKAGEALRQLEQLAQSDTNALFSLAMNYAELGRTDDAMWALNKCFEEREERIVWVNVEPRLASLRGDSRLQEIVARMRLRKF
jgi:TolB-like protein/DNA-binding winged helix-turn-helix (wHTH) protein/Flp pilus assembly protein TadD